MINWIDWIDCNLQKEDYKGKSRNTMGANAENVVSQEYPKMCYVASSG